MLEQREILALIHLDLVIANLLKQYELEFISRDEYVAKHKELIKARENLI